MTVGRASRSHRGGPIAVRPGSLSAAVALLVGMSGAAVEASPLCARGPLAESLLAAVSGLSDQAQVGALAVSIDGADTLFALNHDRRLIPGSNAKIFTTSAFLRRFGPEATLATRIEARGKIDHGKQGSVRLKGELVLRPSGAPDITQILSPGSRGLLDSLAMLLSAAGLREFEGTLWVDGTLFAAEPYGPGWAIEDAAESYGAATGAVLANGNAASLVASGGPKGVTLEVVPAETPFEIAPQVALADTGAGWIEVERLPGSRRLRVVGQVPKGGVIRKQVAVPEPDSTAGLWLLGAMRRAGIKTKGVVRLVPHTASGASRAPREPARDGGDAPPQAAPGDNGWEAVRKDRVATVLVHQSPPIAKIVGVVNAVSLNAEAEGLLRLLDPAPREKRRSGGLAEVRRAASGAGVDTLDLSLVDGSGLSPMNLATPRALVAWLVAHARDSTLAGGFPSGLASPGSVGTLRRRFAGLDSRADLRGKTGTLTNVSSLSGYVTDAAGSRIAFAVMSNGNRGSVAPARQMEERVVGLLVRHGARVKLTPGAPASIPR